MQPFYHVIDSPMEVYTKRNNTFPLHLHKYLECFYVTEGTMRLEVGGTWFDVKPHDFAVVFPDMLHQFYVDDQVVSHGIYVLGATALAGSFADILQKYYPRTPVIESGKVHPDILHGLNTLLQSEGDPYYQDLRQAYFQILLARILPVCDLAEKGEQMGADLAGQAVAYLSGHFKEQVSLSGMARHLGVSPYVLSRVFSGVLKTSFNQYLNELRLDYACYLLQATERPVTDIFLDAGFNSQTTFNRVFREKYLLSPREYRKQSQNQSDLLRRGISGAAALVKGGAKAEAGTQEGLPWKVTKGRFL